MCKVKTPKVPALPPPRASRTAPSRSGAAAAAGQRATSGYLGRNQVPQFALPVLTAKLGGVPTVLGA